MADNNDAPDESVNEEEDATTTNDNKDVDNKPDNDAREQVNISDGKHADTTPEDLEPNPVQETEPQLVDEDETQALEVETQEDLEPNHLLVEDETQAAEADETQEDLQPNPVQEAEPQVVVEDETQAAEADETQEDLQPNPVQEAEPRLVVEDETQAVEAETQAVEEETQAVELEETQMPFVEAETQLVAPIDETQAVKIPVVEAETQLVAPMEEDEDENNNKEVEEAKNDTPPNSASKGRLKRAIESDSDDDDDDVALSNLASSPKASASSKLTALESDDDDDDEIDTGSMLITAKTITGASTYTIHVNPADTIGKIKAKIHGKDGMAVRDQMVLFYGKELENDQTLLESGIQKDSVIMFARRNIPEKKAKRNPFSDDDDSDEELKMAEDNDDDNNQHQHNANNDSDDDDGGSGSGKQPDRAELQKKMTKIFGSDSDSDEDGDGLFDEEPPKPVKQKKAKKERKRAAAEDPEEQQEVRDMTEFEKALERRKKAMKRKRRKVADGEEDITESEAIHQQVLQLKQTMRNAWEADDRQIRTQMKRDFKGKKMPATRKLECLSYVMNELRTTSYMEAMQDLNIFEEMRLWLSPNRDHSLPNFKIRSQLIAILDTTEFKQVHMDLIKSSKIGKVLPWLSQHENETKENKQRLRSIMQSWSRQIFSLHGDTSQVSSEREKHANAISAHVSRQRSGQQRSPPPEEPKHLKPGEAGFIIRARVPRATTKDYAVRPQSNIELEKTDLERLNKSRKVYEKKAAGKFDLLTRKFKDRTMTSTKNKLHANNINLSGNLSGKSG